MRWRDHQQRCQIVVIGVGIIRQYPPSGRYGESCILRHRIIVVRRDGEGVRRGSDCNRHHHCCGVGEAVVGAIAEGVGPGVTGVRRVNETAVGI